MYQLADADGDLSSATVSINVASADDLPIAADDSIHATEDTAFVGSVAGNDTLSGDGGNVFTIDTGPTQGSVTMNANGSFTYTPDANYHGSDSFAYRLSDADGDFSAATVSINVASVDDLPIAADDSIHATEDTAFVGSVAGNDTLSGDGGNVFTIDTAPTQGSVTMNADGSFTYTPDANYHGSDSFVYQLADADGDLSSATVSINVASADDLPVAADDSINATEDTAFVGSVAGNDTLSGDGGNVFTIDTASHPGQCDHERRWLVHLHARCELPW